MKTLDETTVNTCAERDTKRMEQYLQSTHETFVANLKKADELDFQGGVMAGPVAKE